MAVIAVFHITGAIEPPVPWILLALNFVLLIPFTRAARLRQEQKGAMSPALGRYNRRVLIAGFAYMVAMLVAANVADAIGTGAPILWAVAVLPILPVLAMIAAMARYLKEEDDEYLRLRAVNGALAGLALVLIIGTAWGFLEMFGLLPSIWAWWVFPAWSIGLGAAMCWPRGDAGLEAGE
ncbi:hypothetical protein AAW00_07150 [Aurantiacibacter luteus]|uniref:Uncharacterized protein n=2 Tax=Aurantiacibacter luteus TaxID=1581420 RepID=A0A0G9MZV7_9SPHN|nr:hypothetical protein AAW00_07150 [Aurantiacibacter luteus]